jgi:hypothetical protein
LAEFQLSLTDRSLHVPTRLRTSASVAAPPSKK